ncbi:uncharacterized protein LOC116805840 [Drosophila grimshawi]|uniref:uncharacterized protein LOC116805840 n=1 Tax=Drosophila grimshawi TaxID=7222 RepID=UPI000C86E52D|nr:uncharacterized protein LOC116805840 [Drosophila grimshawi]
MKVFLGFCLVFCLAVSHVNANCSADCPDTEDVVWALDGTCLVFRNKCYFDKENCERMPPMYIVSKEECQKKCADTCTTIHQPVTGTYNGEVKHFGNPCLKSLHSCRTGETFVD